MNKKLQTCVCKWLWCIYIYNQSVVYSLWMGLGYLQKKTKRKRNLWLKTRVWKLQPGVGVEMNVCTLFCKIVRWNTYQEFFFFFKNFFQ